MTTRLGGAAPRSERQRAERASPPSVQWIRGAGLDASGEMGRLVGIKGFRANRGESRERIGTRTRGIHTVLTDVGASARPKRPGPVQNTSATPRPLHGLGS